MVYFFSESLTEPMIHARDFRFWRAAASADDVAKSQYATPGIRVEQRPLAVSCSSMGSSSATSSCGSRTATTDGKYDLRLPDPEREEGREYPRTGFKSGHLRPSSEGTPVGSTRARRQGRGRLSRRSTASATSNRSRSTVSSTAAKASSSACSTSTAIATRRSTTSTVPPGSTTPGSTKQRGACRSSAGSSGKVSSRTAFSMGATSTAGAAASRLRRHRDGAHRALRARRERDAGAAHARTPARARAGAARRRRRCVLRLTRRTARAARLYLPSDPLGHQGARPLVDDVHGGPQSQERPNFAWFSTPLIQALTLNGFAGFVPNVRARRATARIMRSASTATGAATTGSTTCSQ